MFWALRHCAQSSAFPFSRVPAAFCEEGNALRDLGLKEIGLYSRVSLKVPIVDGLNQLFCDLNDLLFSHCGGKKSSNLPEWDWEAPK